MASKFLSDTTTKIEFEDGEYIEFYLDLSYEKQIDISNIENPTEAGRKRLFLLAKEWNFKNDKGEEVELNEENFRKISSNVLSMLLVEISKKIEQYQESFSLKKN